MSLSCHLCQRAFARSGNLENHLAKSHLAALEPSTDGRRPPLGVNPAELGLQYLAEDTPFSDVRPTQTTVETYPDAGRPLPLPRISFQYTDAEIYAPFDNIMEYKFASWVIRNNLSKTCCEEYFKNGLASPSISLTSIYKVRQKIEEMGATYSIKFTKKRVDWGIPRRNASDFWYRDILECAAYLLRQPAYARDTVWAPVKETNAQGKRLYSEMHTGDWWWEQQSLAPIGDTIIPLICFSDSTHLTNFSGDKKAWPIYLTIGNLPAVVRNSASEHAIMLLALLPIPPKKDKLSKVEKANIAKLIQDSLADVLRPLNDVEQARDLLCADGYTRRCRFRLAGWIADHMEYCELFGLKSNSCPQCTATPTRLGEYSMETPFAIRDYGKYGDLTEALENAERSQIRTQLTNELNQMGVRPIQIALAQLPNICLPTLHKPDLLHGIYKGLMENILQWLGGFLKKHKRSDSFDASWKSLRPYPGFPGFTQAYSGITQWQGKELRSAGRILMGCLTVALDSPAAAERLAFSKVKSCVRSFLDFHMLAQYRSHDDESIALLQTYWKEFHATRYVFDEFRTVKSKARLEENAQQMLADLERRLQTSELSAWEYDEQTREVGERVERLRSAASGFNYIKMHLPNHYATHIRQFGNLQGFSTDAGESAHRKQLKEGYTHSNKNDAAAQIIDYYVRKNIFRMKELNLIAYARESPESFIQISNHLPFLSKRNFTISDAIKYIHNNKDTTWPLPDLTRTVGDISLKSPRENEGNWTIDRLAKSYKILDLPTILTEYLHNYRVQAYAKGFISDLEWPPTTTAAIEAVNQLRCMPYNQLQLVLPDLADPSVPVQHPIRCTGGRPWMGNKDPLNDFVFFDKSSTGRYGALNGRGVARTEAIFQVNCPYTDTCHDVVFVTELVPLRGGSASNEEGLVQVVRRLVFDAAQYTEGVNSRERRILSTTQITSLAQLIPFTNSDRYVINSFIDIAIYNDIYEYT